MTEKEPIMLTVKKAIEVSGLTRYCIMQLVHEHKVMTIKSGSKFYINYSSLLAYLNKPEESMNKEKGGDFS